jgi:hypothetical protein
MLDGDAAVGAAMMLCYLRDLITVSPRLDYGQSDLLVILEAVSRDHELFPTGVGQVLWACELEDET